MLSVSFYPFQLWQLENLELLCGLLFFWAALLQTASKRLLRSLPHFSDLKSNTCLGFLARAFHTHLSLFFVRRFRSMPSIRFSKHRCIACCFSGGWLFTILFLRSEKYCRAKWGGGSKERRWGKADQPSIICRVEGVFSSNKWIIY